MSCSRLAAAALAVAALAFSGCGGSKSSSGANASSGATTSSTAASVQPLTHPALVAKASQICTRARGQIGAMKASTKQAVISDLLQAATYAETAVGELNRLRAEPALAPDFTKVVEGLHRYAVEATEASERLAAKDQTGAREAFQSYKRDNAAAVAPARRDGLSACVIVL